MKWPIQRPIGRYTSFVPHKLGLTELDNKGSETGLGTAQLRMHLNYHIIREEGGHNSEPAGPLDAMSRQVGDVFRVRKTLKDTELISDRALHLPN